MAETGGSLVTSEHAFCAAIACLAQNPPEASQVEGSLKQGCSNGLVLLDPLHRLLIQQSGKHLCIDRFANHLMQLTRGCAKVSFSKYCKDDTEHEAAYVVRHPGNRPVSLAKLLDMLRGCGTSIWLAQSAGMRQFTLSTPPNTCSRATQPTHLHLHVLVCDCQAIIIKT